MLQNNDVLNKETLLSNMDGDTELLQELIELFLEDYPGSLTEIENAIKEKNANNLERSAHSFKGMLLNFAAIPASDVAFKLEKMGRDADFSQAEEAFLDLKKEIELVKQVLLSFVGKN